MGNNYIIPSLDRALEIIGFLAKQPKGCGITTIADKLGYPKNSVFRILKTLASKGYIIESDRLYQLSAKFLAIGYSAVGETHMVKRQSVLCGNSETMSTRRCCSAPSSAPGVSYWSRFSARSR